MSLCINLKCPRPANTEQMLFCQGCGSELLLAGKYRVAKLMSNKGGFGDTYEVTDGSIPKVLKVLKSTNPKAVELFDREYRVLDILTRQGIFGIPHVEDFFLYSPRDSQQALHCLVMERIDGMDLEEYIRAIQRPIDEKTAIGWMSKLTQILHEIHSRGIFHRDIKPSNVILKPDGQLVLIDFGAVKEAAVNVQGKPTWIYTPGYAAPEQQQQQEVSAQSDFFALGRTFVYLLTNREPADLNDPYQDILIWRDRTSNVSPNFLNLIDRLMQKDPRQRPDSTATILKEIATIRPSTTILSEEKFNQNSDLTKIQKPRFSLLPKIWVPALLGLLALLGWLFWQQQHKSDSANSSTNNKTGESFTEIKDVPSGDFKFGGSTTWATTRQLQSSTRIDDAIKGVFPKYNIIYTDLKKSLVPSAMDGRCSQDPGSNTGICWLMEGDLDFAQSSIDLDKSKYKDDPRLQSLHLKAEAVAYDALTVVVNPRLNISGLTVDDLKKIYTGAVTNWQEIGGQNIPIVAITRPEKSGGTVSSFKDLVLKKETWGQKVQIVNSTTNGLDRVNKNLGGIYYGAAKEVIIDFCETKPIPIAQTGNNFIKPYLEPLQSPDVCRKQHGNKINTEVIKNQEYPLTRKIYVIIKADGTDRQKAGEAYVNLLRTTQGQDLLEKAGFVSIYH